MNLCCGIALVFAASTQLLAADKDSVSRVLRKAASYNDLVTQDRSFAAFERAFARAFNSVDVDANDQLDETDVVLNEQRLQANRRASDHAAFAGYDMNGDGELTDGELNLFASVEIRTKRALGQGFDAPNFVSERAAFVAEIFSRLGVKPFEVLTFEKYRVHVLETAPADPDTLAQAIPNLPADAQGFDENRDSIVTRQEFFEPLLDAMRLSDANNNGILEPEELN